MKPTLHPGLACFLLFALGSLDVEADPRPNVILIFTDDQGWGDTGYNGHPIVQSPHLDRMAREGVRLDRFYAAAPVCSPTRGSILTGRHPSRYGINWAQEGQLPREEITLAERLQDAGYRTGHFGKWHLGNLSRTLPQGARAGNKEPSPARYAPPWENGFSVCFSTSGRVPTHNPYQYADQGTGRFPDGVIPSYADPPEDRLYRWPENYWTGPGTFVDEPMRGDNSEIIMDRVLEFMGADQTPFFACVWFHTPHTPIVAGSAWRQRYEDLSIEEQHWYGSLEAMDHQIGRLMKALQEQGIADRTLIWFGSDNGPSYAHPFGSAGPFSGRKGSLLEGGVRVPGIVYWPGKLDGGHAVSAPVFTSDILPTVLQLTGTPGTHPLPLDGADVSALLMGNSTERPDPLFFHSPLKSEDSPWADPSRFQAAIHHQHFKLLTLDTGASWQLFDLREDPAESTDLASQFPDLVASLLDQYARWRESCQASENGQDY